MALNLSKKTIIKKEKYHKYEFKYLLIIYKLNISNRSVYFKYTINYFWIKLSIIIKYDKVIPDLLVKYKLIYI